MEKTDFSAFGQYIPGFDFLQNLARQATGVAPGLQTPAAMPSLGHWVAPTFSVEEIDKRIQDLRAVAFWLEQNGKALAATIQALEVQKMTLATLENMNLSLQDVAESFKMKPAPAAKAPEPPVQPSAEAGPAGAVDPMQWWNSLTEQFAGIASNALQDMAGQAAKAAEQMAQTVQAGAEAAEKMVEQARDVQQEAERRMAQAAEAPARKRAPARKAGTANQDAPAKPRRKPAG